MLRQLSLPTLSFCIFGLLLPATLFAQVPADSVVLQGDYIRTGVSNNGTLGVGNSIEPGFQFDPTGSGDFTGAADYLTPGIPWEGFTVSHTGGSYTNNNTGTQAIGTPIAPVSPGASGQDNSATWTGTVAGEFTVQHQYGFNDEEKRVNIQTTITALTNLSQLKFARFIDPDSGGSASINTRGNPTLGLAPQDWVNSESETNGATLGLFTDSDTPHNTGIILFPWSENPDDYLAGTDAGTGDNSIGVAFEIGDLLLGEMIVLNYLYAVSADVNDFDLGDDFADRAITPNQMELAGFIDGVGPGAPMGLTDAFRSIFPLGDADFLNALDQINGSIYGSISTANLQHTSHFLSQLATRFRARMAPGDPLTSSGFVQAKKQPEFMLVSYNQPACGCQGCGCQTCGCCRDRCLHRAWVSGYGIGGNLQTDGNAGGFDYSLGGTQFVVEKPLSSNWSYGSWANMAWGTLDGTTLDERADLESYQFGGQLVGFDGCDYWIGLAGLGYNDADVIRSITAADLDYTATGSAEGWQGNLYLERGRSFRIRRLVAQPYAALQYIHLRQNQLTESGAEALNLGVSGLDANSLRSILGGRFTSTFCTRSGQRVTPELRAAWFHEFLDTYQVFTGGFAGTTGGFAVRGLDLGRDWANLGGGLNLELNRHARLFGGYDVQVNDHQTLHAGSGGVEVLW